MQHLRLLPLWIDKKPNNNRRLHKRFLSPLATTMLGRLPLLSLPPSALVPGVPSTLAAMSLGYSANLFGSLTHYASGPAAVFHASGYTRLAEVMRLGLLCALRSWVVWGVLGMAWWKHLGWW
jgi:di/tricarboxylate transporter